MNENTLKSQTHIGFDQGRILVGANLRK